MPLHNLIIEIGDQTPVNISIHENPKFVTYNGAKFSTGGEQTVKELELSAPNAIATLTIGMIDPSRAFFQEEYFDENTGFFAALNPLPVQAKVVLLGVSRKQSRARVIHILVIPPYGNSAAGGTVKNIDFFKLAKDETCKTDGGIEICNLKDNVHRPFYTMFRDDETWRDTEKRQKSRSYLTPPALNPSIPGNTISISNGSKFPVFKQTPVVMPHMTLITRSNKSPGLVFSSWSVYVSTTMQPKPKDVFVFAYGTNEAPDGTSRPTLDGLPEERTDYSGITLANVSFINSESRTLRNPNFNVNTNLPKNIKSLVAKLRGLLGSSKVLALPKISKFISPDIGHVEKDSSSAFVFFESPSGATLIDQPIFYSDLITGDQIGSDPASGERIPKYSYKGYLSTKPWISSEIDQPSTDLMSFDEPIAASSSLQPTAASSAFSSMVSFFEVSK